MGDIDTKSRHLFEVVLKKWVVLIKNVTKSEYLSFWIFVFKNEYIAGETSEYLLLEMGGNGINEECENLSWKVSIFDGKSWAFVFHLVFEMTVPLPAQLPLLVVFCGIKWKMNPKLVGNCSNLVVFEWNLNGINEIRGIDAVWSLDLQLFEWHVC